MLEKYLFTLNPIFERSLSRIRDVCFELSKLRLHDLKANKLCTLQDFCIAQAQHKDRCLDHLSDFSTATVDTVRQACTSALAQLEERLFGRTGAEDTHAAGPDAVNPSKEAKRGKGGVLHAAKVEDDSSKFTYAVTAAKRSEQRRLLNYIRLVDYMVCDTLRVLLVDSISDLLNVLRHQPPVTDIPLPVDPHMARVSRGDSLYGEDAEMMSPTPVAIVVEAAEELAAAELLEPKPQAAVAKGKTPVFEVQILMHEDLLVFSPNSEEFQERVQLVIVGFLDMIGTVNRLLTHHELKGFVDGGAELEMSGNIADMMTDDGHSKLTYDVRQNLGMAFEDAEEFKMTFLPYRDMVIDNRQVTMEAMRLQVEEGERTLDRFRADIRQFKAQHQKMMGLLESRDMGIVRVSTLQLKNTFTPSPVKCLDLIAALLPELAAARYQSFIAEIHEANTKLLAIPGTVEEFVDFVNFLAQCVERRDELEARYAEVVKHYELMEEFGITVPEIEFAAYQTLAPDFVSFKTALDVAETSKEEHVSKFAADLSKDVEALNRDVGAVRLQAQHEMILDESSDTDTVLSYTKELLDTIQVHRQRADQIKAYQKLFSVPPSRFDELLATCDEIELKHGLWESLQDWSELTAKWSEHQFNLIDVADLEEKVNKYNKMVMRLQRGLPPNKLVPILQEKVHEFKETLPVITNLRNPALKERHWEKVQEQIGHKVVHDETFTLGVLLSLKVMDHKEKIAQISTEATQEAALGQLLQKVQSKWSFIEFTVNNYKESKDIYILGTVDEVTAALEDSMVTMTTITASRFVAGIRNEVEKLEKSLRLFSDVLDEWLECQKNWIYLETIFSAPDIQRQLPFESKAFFAVDKAFKDIMRRTRDRPNALMAGTTPGWLETFKKCNETLEKVQKNLEDYLETKRMAFPRFYFLSNDELLEILSQTKNVQAVQPHMSKCFDGIRRLDFGEDPKSIDIYAMISGEGERVSLGKNLKARGNVEVWLTLVESHMGTSLRRLAKMALNKYVETPRTEWVLQHPAQMVVTISQIYWCQQMEDRLKSSETHAALSEFLETNVAQLAELTKLVVGELLPLERRIIVPLITVDVHARDIVEQLMADGVGSTNDFGWLMQLRFYWDEVNDEVTIKQVNAQFQYGYEYLGAQPRLVVTPMTDRCYMTLTGALHMNLGGSPAGPAGTGKTETTKDLGKALGVQCVVFNCGDNLDFKFMGKFFSGLAQAGAWACFDEFNRIDIEVLSVVAQQLLTIQNALKAGVSRFMFEGREIRLINTCGVFITMNPGYAGRTELPDNLKALFRPMSMMVPDYALVAEVMLFAEGFSDAKTLSRKMVKLYKLSSEQLSQQDHYDFGMRALKSVLVMAGSLKRSDTHLSEAVVLIRAMRDSNLPKFLSDDADLFSAIITDLFPGEQVPEQDYGELAHAIEQSIKTAGLQPKPVFVTKVVQLFETFNVRFGVMLVGPTGGGKTCIYRQLQAACTLLREERHPDERYQITHTYVLNPKCIKMGELYGEYNLLTNEWTDGLGSTLIRQSVADTTEDRKWVVFDGPVDAIWIENMNTVLDDNCTLCLPNGERIKLNGTTMRMLFEVQDLAVASPATVSRCGMVYVPPEEMGWQPYARSWLDAQITPLKIAPEMVTYLWQLFEDHVDRGINFVREKCKESIPSVNINLVTSLTFLLQSLLAPGKGVDFTKPAELVQNLVNNIFSFSFIWGIGGNINLESQRWLRAKGSWAELLILTDGVAPAAKPGEGLLGRETLI
ncbi:hypothetical protein CYMTET_52552 [Cymbomonas tetramitiformis]|uniref:Dynein heavy chain n=1 Tax=Cymbomonas tetramitiformis TaxID=36881 RepID=A0AAE0ERI7_9CHLO|nr:hypothetical protein CYMTET_52552 [Cymbomonas tetramitiformis]